MNGDETESTRARRVNMAVTVLLVLAVVFVVVTTGAKLQDESSYGPEVCDNRLDRNATWINDSDDTIDCRWPNGTVVEDLPMFLNATSAE